MEGFAFTRIGLVILTVVLSPGCQGLGTTLIEGDVYIELIASVYSKSHDNGTCYDIDTESVQNIEAVRWVLTKLNEGHRNNENKGIGLRVSCTCQSVSRAETLALKLAMEMEKSPRNTIIGISLCNHCCGVHWLHNQLVNSADPDETAPAGAVSSGSSLCTGVLGADYSSEAQAVSLLLSALPGKYRLPMVGYRTTAASLSDHRLYRNFIRTIPSDVTQTKVMVSFMKKLNWTYMALVYDDNSYGRGGMKSLMEHVDSPDICFPVQIPIKTDEESRQDFEDQLMTQVLNATIPVQGIVVFGDAILADKVLMTTENILSRFPAVPRPTFLFSEGSGYIHTFGRSKFKGYYVLSPPRRNITTFEESFRELFRNLTTMYGMSGKYRYWLKEVYRSAFDCVLPANTSLNTCPALSDSEIISKLPPSIFNQYAIQAALTLVGIEQRVRSKLCQQKPFCSKYFEAPRQLFLDQTVNLSVNFDLHFSGVRIAAFRDPDLMLKYSGTSDAVVPQGFPLYEVYNSQWCNGVSSTSCLVKVAYMTHDNFNLIASNIRDYDGRGTERKWPNITKPQCPEGAVCRTCTNNKTFDHSILFEPGDMYIVGVAPVHNPGDSPLQCGPVKDGILDIVEAIRFAVKEAKLNYKNKIPDGKIGLIIIDSCNDPHIIQERIISLHRHGVYQQFKYIPVADRIIGYIGGYSSDVSATIATMSKRLGFGQISYGATAVNLSNRNIYPNFLRILSSDTFQAEAILAIVKQLGVNLIQVVHSTSEYGKNGRWIISEKAKTMGICVDTIHSFSSFNDTSDLVESLQKTSDARVVVLFLSSFDLELLLPALKKSSIKRGEFVFICSDGWGKRFDVSELRNIIGSITLTPEMFVNEKFKEHLKRLRPERSNTDPWVREYMEKVFHCHYEWSYNKSWGHACGGNERLDVYRINYTVDAWSPFAERATLALLQGAKIALDDQCGHSRNICEAFRQNPVKPSNSPFNDINVSMLYGYFVGDGQAGYQFYVLDMEGGTVKYKKIGGSSPAFAFNVQLYPKQVKVSSSCGEQDACQVCFPTSKQNGADGYPVWVLVVMSLLLLICLILTGSMLFVCRRHGYCPRLESGRVVFKDNCTPVYGRSSASCSKEESGYYVKIRDGSHHEYACPHDRRCSCPMTDRSKHQSNQRDTKSSSYCEYILGNINPQESKSNVAPVPLIAELSNISVSVNSSLTDNNDRTAMHRPDTSGHDNEPLAIKNKAFVRLAEIQADNKLHDPTDESQIAQNLHPTRKQYYNNELSNSGNKLHCDLGSDVALPKRCNGVSDNYSPSHQQSLTNITKKTERKKDETINSV